MTEPEARHLIGIDVGGTFTDVVLRNEVTGSTQVAKVPSTPADQSIGFMEGIGELGVNPETVALLIHGTTVATNAVIERKGVSCALVTTRGFKDVLELGRRDRPEVYGLRGTTHPLIPRDRRLEVDERVRADGRVEQALDPDQLIAALQPYMDSVQAVVISFLHSYVNPRNEDHAYATVRDRWPDHYVIAAGRTLPKIGEFERTSTAVIHAYVQPIMANYLGSLAKRVGDAGHARLPAIVGCNGGIMSLQHAIDRPANTVRSGPAAGVIAGAAVARSAGFANAITADMGGTSFDVALVVEGQPDITDEKLVDFRIPLRLPTIDVETIGAGGGSLARLDDAGILRVGPESAGSIPGPACYGRGGTLPTVTDANVVLHRINADRPIGGDRLHLDSELSRIAVETHVAEPLNLTTEEAAEAILRVIDSRMAGQARIMSVGRGHDPRTFALIPFGGAGPLHAEALAREVGIPTVVIPPLPGVTSAIGCIDADVQYDFAQSFRQRLDTLDIADANKLIAAFATEGKDLIAQGGVPVTEVDVVVEPEMHYLGQRHPIRVEVPLPLDRSTIREAFRAGYRRRYGAELDAPIVVVDLNCRVIGRRPMSMPLVDAVTERSWDEAITSSRNVYFAGEWLPVPVLERALLSNGMTGTGPAIVEQGDTTVIVHPGSHVRMDAIGNLLLELAL